MELIYDGIENAPSYAKSITTKSCPCNSTGGILDGKWYWTQKCIISKKTRLPKYVQWLNDLPYWWIGKSWTNTAVLTVEKTKMIQMEILEFGLYVKSSEQTDLKCPGCSGFETLSIFFKT